MKKKLKRLNEKIKDLQEERSRLKSDISSKNTSINLLKEQEKDYLDNYGCDGIIIKKKAEIKNLSQQIIDEKKVMSDLTEERKDMTEFNQKMKRDLDDFTDVVNQKITKVNQLDYEIRKQEKYLLNLNKKIPKRKNYGELDVVNMKNKKRGLLGIFKKKR
jgi:chromosome segregation ATPase